MLFLKVLYTLTTAYDLCENNSLENAMKDMEEAENSFDKLKQQIPNGLSMKAVEHVVKGTKCFILQKMNKSNDIKSILETIPLCEDNFELGTLYGCQSAVWSYYYYTGWKKSMEYGKRNFILIFLILNSAFLTYYGDTFCQN
ncbi:uncharacterized protein LOC107272330 [Cephus cinctus]|uniref:Uncharacterized protein LOC107272330 n=1 Tax=Cephus cinctus TaxID=211228 RepID=A0AAJ7CA14_CEPCN|nr:uncharacterized protein LOC107272330 [Cephus cinctus]